MLLYAKRLSEGFLKDISEGVSFRNPLGRSLFIGRAVSQRQRIERNYYVVLNRSHFMAWDLARHLS